MLARHFLRRRRLCTRLYSIDQSMYLAKGFCALFTRQLYHKPITYRFCSNLASNGLSPTSTYATANGIYATAHPQRQPPPVQHKLTPPVTVARTLAEYIEDESIPLPTLSIASPARHRSLTNQPFSNHLPVFHPHNGLSFDETVS